MDPPPRSRDRPTRTATPRRVRNYPPWCRDRGGGNPYLIPKRQLFIIHAETRCLCDLENGWVDLNSDWNFFMLALCMMHTRNPASHFRTRSVRMRITREHVQVSLWAEAQGENLHPALRTGVRNDVWDDTLRGGGGSTANARA